MGVAPTKFIKDERVRTVRKLLKYESKYDMLMGGVNATEMLSKKLVLQVSLNTISTIMSEGTKNLDNPLLRPSFNPARSVRDLRGEMMQDVMAYEELDGEMYLTIPEWRFKELINKYANGTKPIYVSYDGQTPRMVTSYDASQPDNHLMNKFQLQNSAQGPDDTYVKVYAALYVSENRSNKMIAMSW